ncbi:type II toxin-antitoxin system PemK/MazF family toxin [Desulfofustis glycolicus]|uniref:Right handed beta helix region n=1 Tax=Desulfofustis glycolicus DSM 9705 TaxID=1121409 RepID=A0A1M5VQL0_9BACT|nr:type II toxin-antitoxin system PemK/MazF family toxin [Desulfofustis glycolicus]SHH77468.1 hypothetical protein SAMN02745124_01816 [Desulfofustis glycolicus DSM 9705]
MLLWEDTDVVNGIVRNNIIYGRRPHDTAIEMVHATGWLVVHNTVLLLDPLPGLSWGMEARYADTTGTFANNLANMTIWENRDGAAAVAGSENIEAADPGWLVDLESYDFRLTSRAGPAIDRGSTGYLGQTPEDFYGELRDAAPDVGADEWQPGVSDVIETLGVLAGLAGASDLVDDINNDGVIGLAERKNGQIVLDQIRTVDKKRLVRRLGVISKHAQDKTLQVLQEMFAR